MDSNAVQAFELRIAELESKLAEAREQLRVCQGLSRQQGQYTQNAVAECLRLRKIISGCQRCATMHNAPGGEEVQGE